MIAEGIRCEAAQSPEVTDPCRILHFFEPIFVYLYSTYSHPKLQNVHIVCKFLNHHSGLTLGIGSKDLGMEEGILTSLYEVFFLSAIMCWYKNRWLLLHGCMTSCIVYCTALTVLYSTVVYFLLSINLQ